MSSTRRQEILDALEHPPKNGVSRAIYDAVEFFHAADKLSQNAAIHEVAMRTGREVGTVSANYYRYKRELLPKVGSQPVRVDVDLRAVVQEINEGFAKILEAYEAKSRECERLTAEAAKYEMVRQAVLGIAPQQGVAGAQSADRRADNGGSPRTTSQSGEMEERAQLDEHPLHQPPY